MTSQTCAVVFMYQYRWLGLGVTVLLLVVSLYTLWSLKRHAHDLARHSDRFADALETLGQFDQAAELTRAATSGAIELAKSARRAAKAGDFGVDPGRAPRTTSEAEGGDPR